MLRPKLPKTSSILLILIALSGPLTARAVTFTVTNLGNSGAGSLRQAVLDAGALGGKNTIQFQSGLSGTLLLTASITLNGDLTINGPGAQVLAISGNSASQLF